MWSGLMMGADDDTQAEESTQPYIRPLEGDLIRMFQG